MTARDRLLEILAELRTSTVSDEAIVNAVMSELWVGELVHSAEYKQFRKLHEWPWSDPRDQPVPDVTGMGG